MGGAFNRSLWVLFAKRTQFPAFSIKKRPSPKKQTQFGSRLPSLVYGLFVQNKPKIQLGGAFKCQIVGAFCKTKPICALFNQKSKVAHKTNPNQTLFRILVFMGLWVLGFIGSCVFGRFCKTNPNTRVFKRKSGVAEKNEPKICALGEICGFELGKFS
jgi:hypothetical protein